MSPPTTIEISEVMDTLRIVSTMTSARSLRLLRCALQKRYIPPPKRAKEATVLQMSPQLLRCVLLKPLILLIAWAPEPKPLRKILALEARLIL
ncbi:hypothetical protein NW765_010371 [Fusarium oxysporum]|nr:hypothetical protein NW765_010371 [Fusarium oxysporum]